MAWWNPLGFFRRRRKQEDALEYAVMEAWRWYGVGHESMELCVKYEARYRTAAEALRPLEALLTKHHLAEEALPETAFKRAYRVAKSERLLVEGRPCESNYGLVLELRGKGSIPLERRELIEDLVELAADADIAYGYHGTPGSYNSYPEVFRNRRR